MKFERTHLEGVWLITLEPRRDERGHFLRTYCEEEFRIQGLHTTWPQANETFTLERGSVRGMHWQREPHGETKLVRCVQGAVWHVVVDVRAESPTFGHWQGFELASREFRALYIPPGYAHGCQTLTDNVVLAYQMGAPYHADHFAGFRWNDPRAAIEWPLPVTAISTRDRTLPPLADAVIST